MARLQTIKFMRGTLAQLVAAAASSQLIEGEPYLVTDTGQIAVGTSVSTYKLFSLSDHVHAGVYEPVDATILRQADVDDTPVDAATTVPVSSNWAYDHINAADPHTQYLRNNADDTTSGGITSSKNGIGNFVVNRLATSQYGGIAYQTAGVNHWLSFMNNDTDGTFYFTSRNYNTDGSHKNTIYTVDWTTGVMSFTQRPAYGSYGLLSTNDVYDTATDGVTGYPISANWAYDHENDDDIHSTILKRVELRQTSVSQNAQSAHSVQWDTNNYIDTDVFTHSTSTNNHQTTVLETGLYGFDLSLLHDNTDVARACVSAVIRVNGVAQEFTRCRDYSRGAAIGNHIHSQISKKIPLTANDIIDVYVTKEHSTAANAINNVAASCSLTISKVGTTALTNTWRGIDDTPVNGQTSESISSNWAYEHLNDEGEIHGLWNYFHNPQFKYWDYGTTQSTSGLGSVTRWRTDWNLDTTSVSQGVFTLGDSIGHKDITYFYQASVTGNAGAAAYTALGQRLPRVETFSNQRVVVVIWIKSSAAGKYVSMNCRQYFGSGGSADVNTQPTSNKQAANTFWNPHYFIFNIPSTASKTINAGSYIEFRLFFSAGSDYNTQTGSLGAQSSSWSVAWPGLVRAETEETPTVLIKPDMIDYLECRKHLVKFDNTYLLCGSGMAWGTTECRVHIPTIVEMYKSPSVTLTGTSGTLRASHQGTTHNLTVPSTATAVDNGLHMVCTSSGLTAKYPMAVDLNNNSKLLLEAEL